MKLRRMAPAAGMRYAEAAMQNGRIADEGSRPQTDRTNLLA